MAKNRSSTGNRRSTGGAAEGGRCDRFCIVLGAGRWLYLLGGTLFTLGFVVEMICLGIIIGPYLNEHKFKAAVCKFQSSYYTGDQFCQDVFSRDPSSFPCLTVRVTFNGTSSGFADAGGATIYLMYTYYAEATLPAKCVSRICYKDKLLNARQIANLNATMYSDGNGFQCYVRKESINGWEEYSALRGREFSQGQVFHCILWPLLACGLGLVLIWFVYCVAGCSAVWGSAMSI